MNTLSRNLARSSDSVSTARQLVSDHTTTLGFQRREDAALMVSELVTNAVLHGTGAITLRIDLEADAVRVEVPTTGMSRSSPLPRPSFTADGDYGSSTSSPMTGASSTAARRCGSDSTSRARSDDDPLERRNTASTGMRASSLLIGDRRTRDARKNGMVRSSGRHRDRFRHPGRLGRATALARRSDAWRAATLVGPRRSLSSAVQLSSWRLPCDERMCQRPDRPVRGIA